MQLAGPGNHTGDGCPWPPWEPGSLCTCLHLFHLGIVGRVFEVEQIMQRPQSPGRERHRCRDPPRSMGLNPQPWEGLSVGSEGFRQPGQLCEEAEPRFRAPWGPGSLS